MDQNEKEFIRLSDRILASLELALEQEDLKIAEHLTQALELAMTRNTGGEAFVERRDYSAAMETAMEKLYALRDKRQAS